jgi:hypothetical protein
MLDKNTIAYLELFASLQGQPERRFANKIMIGGSTYTARWGLSLGIGAVASTIPPCQHCLLQFFLPNKYRSVTHHNCPNCVNWQTDIRHGCLQYEPPKDYPEDQIPLSGKLSPIKLSYDVLKAE